MSAVPASSADSQAVRAWTPPEPLAEGEDSGYEPEWYDEGGGPVTAEPARRWAGELISPFAAEAAEAEAVSDAAYGRRRGAAGSVLRRG